MKKCPRCQVAFKDDLQIKCLYCDGSLISTDLLAFQKNTGVNLAEPKQLRFNDPLTNQRKAYLIGTFLRGRTFLSSFVFSLSEIKKGKNFKRFFIQPIDIGYIIKIPWFFVNFLCSVFYHILYQKYCPECGWKYVTSDASGAHSKDQCEYNKEYNRLTEEIFSGNVFIDLEELTKESEEKRKNGKRSAYYDARHRNKSWEALLDIFAILTSIVIYIYSFTIVVMPIMGKIYHF